ncbi:hypothetical protein FKO01_38890 [Mesorhizobium sp. B2-3-3]|nr:hypothetical protein FKO01_38890 [Mesorhizobium sp. B2-3-3]
MGNAREPSRYIRELSEIAGDKLCFETVAGDLLRQCPACWAGYLVERTGTANRRFLGCSQFPNYEDTARLKQQSAAPISFEFTLECLEQRRRQLGSLKIEADFIERVVLES